jgi:hypothetical protein
MQAQVALKLICRKTSKPFYPYEGEEGKVRCSECHEVIYTPSKA